MAPTKKTGNAGARTTRSRTAAGSAILVEQDNNIEQRLRSTRASSRASSKASVAVPEKEAVGGSFRVKKTTATRGPKGGVKLFSVSAALAEIYSSEDNGPVSRLTLPQAQGVIRLAKEVTLEKDQEIAKLIRERDDALARLKSNTKLRAYEFQKRMEAIAREQGKLAAPKVPETPQFPATSPIAPSIAPPTSTPSSAAPSTKLAAGSTPATEPARAALSATPRWKTLLENMGGLISPMLGRRPVLAPAVDTTNQEDAQNSRSTQPRAQRNDDIAIRRPSTKDYWRPSSLGTVSEKSELSERSTRVPTATPSRRPKRKASEIEEIDLSSPEMVGTPEGLSSANAPQMRVPTVTFSVPDLRPRPAAPTPSKQVTFSVPDSPAMSAAPTPTRQRVSVKDRLAAIRDRTPSKPRAWEKRPAPVDKNADARVAKIRRLEQLQKSQQAIEKELTELNNDKEVNEIIGHRVKRVKIDDLVTIPARPPGCTAGTYAFPDINSDDEMDVSEEVEVYENVFAKANPSTKESPKASTEKTPMVSPVKAPTVSTEKIPAASTDRAQANATTTQPPPSSNKPVKKWDWPEVGGPIPDDYVRPPQEELNRLGAKFGAEFEAWMQNVVAI